MVVYFRNAKAYFLYNLLLQCSSRCIEFRFPFMVLSQRRKSWQSCKRWGLSKPNYSVGSVRDSLNRFVSMAFGIVLGAGLHSFNGFFDIFGFIFQIFGGSSALKSADAGLSMVTVILVSLAVFAAVVVALLVTTSSINSRLGHYAKGMND